MLTRGSKNTPLRDLFSGGRRLTYKKGEFIIRPGEITPGVFYIEKGLVKACDITKYGEENLLIIRKAGDIIGLTWAMTGQDRNIVYSTLAPTELTYVTGEQFRENIRNKRDSSVALVEKFTEMYRLHSERIISLEYRSVRERLVSFLLSMADRFGKRSLRGITIEVPLKYQDIAGSINASRETVNRELIGLERMGLLSCDSSTITILNKRKMKKYLE